MGYIDREGFRIWLYENYTHNERLIRDTVSRADRVRRAFEKVDINFSYEKEIEKDYGQSLWNLLSRRGIDIPYPIALPIGSNQMDTISSAAKKYILFLRGITEQ